MHDFYKIKEREGIGAKKGTLDVYPDYTVVRSKDLMVRAKSFYAIWDEKVGLWSTDEYDVQRLVDAALRKHEIYTPGNWIEIHRRYLGDFSSNSWLQFRNYVSHLTDNSTQLDENLTFANTEVKKEDYVSRRLNYPLAEGDISAYDELMNVLYNPEERAKLEWAIGAVVAGDSKNIQKFIVLYGPGGTGKSTVLNIIMWLFEGYVANFEASSLASANNQFSTAAFKDNPLVAIQHDGDLSKISDNTKLNSIISHEDMLINEKNKPSYSARINAFLFMGTNKPVKITDAKSGIIRRLIDVHPSGNKVSPRKYQTLMTQIKFELGAIAFHCLQTYREMGKDYYSTYRPVEMMLQTDVFFNYIEAHYDIFKEQNGVTLRQAYELYKEFCKETTVEYVMPQYKFREELRNYFDTFEDRAIVDDIRVRSWYGGFNADRFKVQVADDMAFSLVLDETESLFDKLMANKPAQYAKADGTPRKYWTDKPKMVNGKEVIPKPEQVVDTKLKDIDTHKEHYVRVPLNHIVIDFDLEDAETGEKSLEKNLEAGSQWPATYAELSKSGQGLHLHYEYEGDPLELARMYEPGIEIKVYSGDQSLRRKLTKCNNVPVAKISGGLPLKEKKKMTDSQSIQSEKSLRDLIGRNLRKEIHPGTKPSMDFIHKILEDAYASGLPYDVTDMRPKILAFANNSTHQALACIKLVQTMKFASEPVDVPKNDLINSANDEPVFYDVEVFPNLVVVCWKKLGGSSVVRMINPKPREIEELMSFKLIGFNNRRYDNHILYGIYMGYSVEKLYQLSQKIIANSINAGFGEAYNISYADIYDFSSKKQSLKKFQIELGLRHMELGLPWDQPVPKELWNKVADYCANDVETTEQVFEARKEDFIARQILADLSGLPVNSSTQAHTAKIVFGDERRPQSSFVYTNLAEQFPGYEFNLGKSSYKGEDPGEGGYVYAEPGMYENVAVLDVASMHPTSIEQLDLFGPYTKNFSALKKARIAIKRGDYENARTMLNGMLAKHLTDPDEAEKLSYALKIVINIVYGLTSAKFDNSFRDPRNIDNIVAKRGALFMIDLKYAVMEQGYQVVHIKTDSIKIVNADQKIIDFVMEFGNDYGYEFEHEATYEKFCLVNDAVYIAKTLPGRKPAHWEAVGAQFQHPVVFKTLFSKEKIKFEDYCETKTVTTALYLDFNGEEAPMALANDMYFVGKAGSFIPILPGRGGGSLMREKDGKFYAASGTKGYRWLEAEMVKTLKKEDDIDMRYYENLIEEAKNAINQFGDYEWFAP